MPITARYGVDKTEKRQPRRKAKHLRLHNVCPLLRHPQNDADLEPHPHYWAGLEKSWNGYLLNTADTVINRAGNFCWKGMRTVVSLVDDLYEKGVKICNREKKRLEQRLMRSTYLNWWDITIQPKMVSL